MFEKYVCVHGHFYQPPRENPWLEKIEAQESASPYHDWNQKITAQCYGPNSMARIVDENWMITGLTNNYSQISFDFGPTLLYWLEQNEESIYQAILDADKQSIKKFSGHGSAIAQAYNHMILPLANKRDKITQVRWGIRDFELRFQRVPEGMWLPETAVDIETLEIMAEQGIKFTLLSPGQAKRIKKIGAENWIDVSGEKIDPQRAYLCKLPSGRTINIIFFDKRVSSDAAFGDLLSNGENLGKRLVGAFNESYGNKGLVSIASDGELYGHHHPLGDMTLAYCLNYITLKNLAKVTNYAEFLEKQPADYEVEIIENTSWSCSHGIERWRNDCGDNNRIKPGWNQKWRKPLREALDWLRDSLAPSFEQAAKEYFEDPWEARDNYIQVINDRSEKTVMEFLNKFTRRPLNKKESGKAIKLLEMQRQAMLMYTSCGWFFDELSGIETLQILAYAARLIQLVNDFFDIDLERQFISMLAKAPSNIAEFGDGAYIYNNLVKPQIADLKKIGAQHGIVLLFQKEAFLPHETSYSCFQASDSTVEFHENGRFRLSLGQIEVRSNIVFDGANFSFIAIWLGDHNVSCGISQEMPEDRFKILKNEVIENFSKGLVNETIQLLNQFFGDSNYSLKDLFRDDKNLILSFIMSHTIQHARELNNIIFEDSFAMLRFMQQNKISAPFEFQVAAQIAIDQHLRNILTSEKTDIAAFEKLLADIKQLNVKIDTERIALQASKSIAAQLEELSKNPRDTSRINTVNKLIEGLNQISVNLNLWNAQNIAFNIAQTSYKSAKENNQSDLEPWVTAFERLAESLKIRLS